MSRSVSRALSSRSRAGDVTARGRRRNENPIHFFPENQSLSNAGEAQVFRELGCRSSGPPTRGSRTRPDSRESSKIDRRKPPAGIRTPTPECGVEHQTRSVH